MDTSDHRRPFLMTKLAPPAARFELLRRSRLIDRLSDAVHTRLTLISAPAGFGKTSLLCQWIAASGNTTAWVSLDRTDNDSSKFFSYLIAALQGKGVQVDFRANGMSGEIGTEQRDILLAELINSVDATPSLGEIFLVLDDYQSIENHDIHDAIKSMMLHLPQRLHLIIATRSDPPLQLALLRARGELSELRAADLRFTPAENEAFFGTIMKLDTAQSELAELDNRLEGWAAGLRIATNLIRDADSVRDSMRAISGSHPYFADYLMDEALRPQPLSTQRFLLRTSILDSFNVSLAEAVTGQPDAGAIVDQLLRASLFIVSADGSGEWLRYHHLLVEALRSHLGQAYPDDLTELHLRASRWYSANGLIQEALKHALAAADVSIVTDLLEQTGMAYASRGDLCRSTGPDTPSLSQPGASSLPEGTLQSRRNVNLAYWWKSNLVQASEMLAQASRMSQAVGYSSNAVSALTQLAGLQIIRGELNLAAESYRQALWFAREYLGRCAGQEGVPYVGMGLLCYERNRLDDAARHTIEGLELGKQSGNPAVLAGGLGALAMIEYASGKMDVALDMFAQAEEVAREKNLSRYAAGVAARRARLWLLHGQVEEAVSWARATGLSVYDEPTPLREAEYVVLARVRIAEGKAGEALQLIDRMLAAAESAGRVGRVVKLLALRALGLAAGGGTEEALDSLRRALALAEPQGYMRSLIDLGPGMRQLLAEVRDCVLTSIDDRRTSLDYITSLQAAFEPRDEKLLESVPTLDVSQLRLRPLIRREPRRRLDLLAERLSERELEVLRLLEAGESNRDIALDLVVAVSTVKKHINNIYGKLNVRSRTQAIAKARERGMLSPSEWADGIHGPAPSAVNSPPYTTFRE